MKRMGGVRQNCGATKILFCGRGLHVFSHMSEIPILSFFNGIH